MGIAMNLRKLLTVVSLMTMVAFNYASMAVGQTWDGGADNDNWSKELNWGGIVPAPGSTLIFGGSTRLNNNNDFVAGTEFSILFDSGAGAFTLAGNSIKLGNGFGGPGSIGFTGNPAAPITQTINLGIEVALTSTVTTRANGNIAIGGNVTGNGGLTKAGQGTLSLAGANSYLGATTISGGTLQLGNGGTGGTISTGSAISVGTGATFSVNQSDTVTQGTDFSGSAISGNGGFTQAGSGTTILNAANTYAGATNVTGGTLQLGNGGANGSLATSSTINVAAGATFRVNQNDAVFQGTDFSGSAITGAGNFTQAGTGTTVLTAANTYSGATNITAGTLQLGAGGASGSLSASGTINIGSAGTLRISRNNTVTQGVDFSSSAITGAGNLELAGTGVTVLTAANSYSGATNINSGVLQLGNGGTTGSLATTGTINIASGATFVVNQSDLVTQGVDFSSSAITGLGGFTQAGTGTTVLTAANTYTGDTTVLAGNLVINGSLTSSNINVSTGATLSGDGAFFGDTTIDGTLTGSGTYNGNIAINGVHSPGNSPGLTTVNGNLTYNAGSSVQWELINNTTSGRGVNFDAINVTGNLDFAGPTSFDMFFNISGSNVDWNDSFWGANQSWHVYQVGGTTTGLSNLSINTVDWVDGFGNLFDTVRAGSQFTFTQTGSDIYLQYGPTSVPEPGSIVLMSVAGLFGGGGFVRRYIRKRRKPTETT
jgi:fibronectin-binding autotransporter adhesin